MAFVLLTSTSGIGLDFHICSGHIASLAIWKDAPNCLELAAKSCCSTKSAKKAACTSPNKECHPGCCKDVEIIMDAELDLVLTSQLASDDDVGKNISDVYTGSIQGFRSDTRYAIPFIINYRPPPRQVGTTLSLYQSWLL
ncbi:MAG: hypothetical protein R3275_01165 [Saprospiraceae bacterium]|nr:hypothetical protein [Saprospiraceae bacterium]